jgi:hypothetical protein
MHTEELLNAVETLVLTKNPEGFTALQSEVYILPVLGTWICRPYMTKNKIQTRANAAEVKRIIAELDEQHRLCGVVQVSSGWSADEDGNKQEVLLFNGSGPYGKRVRIYKVVKKGRLKKVAGLMGAFENMKRRDEL